MKERERERERERETERERERETERETEREPPPLRSHASCCEGPAPTTFLRFASVSATTSLHGKAQHLLKNIPIRSSSTSADFSNSSGNILRIPFFRKLVLSSRTAGKFG